MKQYDVYYVVKKNNNQYCNKEVIEASTAKEARDKCAPIVQAKFGVHAFHVTTVKPEDYGVAPEYKG